MKIFAGLLLSVVALNAAASSVCVNEKNALQCHQGTLNGIAYKGDVNFTNTIVNGLSKLQGNTDITNASFDNLNLKGNASLSSTQVNSLTVKGNIFAKDVTVTGDANVLGKFYAANTTLSANTKFIGSIDCDHCTFGKDTSLFGDVIISDSTVLGALNLNSGHNAFFQSKLQDVTVKKSSGLGKQVVSLSNNTTVNNIHFEGKNGVVMLDATSTITGVVDGGTVIRSHS